MDLESVALKEHENSPNTKMGKKVQNMKRPKYNKNNAGGRKCLKIEKNGKSYIIPLERHKLAHILGVQLRDLRLLDPSYATNYPSAILCRDCALIVNLEHIKAIITTSYVLVMNPESNGVDRFVEEIEKKLTEKSYVETMPYMPHSVSKKMQRMSHRTMSASNLVDHLDLAQNNTHRFIEGFTTTFKSGLTDLPFELKILEVCLESICSTFDELTGGLEETGYQAVDCLMVKVNTTNLQRVRTIKRSMFQLKTRVETTKEVLEKFLEDDEDMKSMNLTSKEFSFVDNRADLSRKVTMSRGVSFKDAKEGDDAGSVSSITSDSLDEEVQEVEMLLEAYFMQLDNTFNKLETLCEFINDTEDYINIVQDKHQNQLLQLELIIGAGTFSLTFITVIAGIFGMNLNSKLEDSPHVFTLVSVISPIGAFLVMVLILIFCNWKGLMFV